MLNKISLLFEIFKCKHLLLFFCMASLGIQKILLMIASIIFWGKEDAGLYAAEISVCYFVTLITSLGYSASILKYVPRMEISEGKIYGQKIWLSVLFVSMFVSLLVSVSNLVVPNILHYLGLNFYLFIVSMSLQQVYRHYFISLGMYGKAVFYDSVFLLSQLFPMAVFDINEYFIFTGGIVFIMLIGVVLNIFGGWKLSRETIFDKESFIFSINNLVSAGVAICIPKIVSMKESGDVVAIIALYSSILSIFLLFQRGIISKFVPQVTQLHDNYKALVVRYEEIKFLMKRVQLFCVLCPAAIYFALYFFLESESYISDLTIEPALYFSVLFFVVSGTFGMVNGSLLFVINKQVSNLMSNVVYFLLSFLVFFIYVKFSLLSLEVMLCIVSILSVSRSFYLKFVVDKFFENYFRKVK